MNRLELIEDLKNRLLLEFDIVWSWSKKSKNQENKEFYLEEIRKKYKRKKIDDHKYVEGQKLIEELVNTFSELYALPKIEMVREYYDYALNFSEEKIEENIEKLKSKLTPAIETKAELETLFKLAKDLELHRERYLSVKNKSFSEYEMEFGSGQKVYQSADQFFGGKESPPLWSENAVIFFKEDDSFYHSKGNKNFIKWLRRESQMFTESITKVLYVDIVELRMRQEMDSGQLMSTNSVHLRIVTSDSAVYQCDSHNHSTSSLIPLMPKGVLQLKSIANWISKKSGIKLHSYVE